MELKLTFNSVEDYKKARTSLDAVGVPFYPDCVMSKGETQSYKPILTIAGEPKTIAFVLTQVLDGSTFRWDI